jgi:hypothetical protein
MMKKSILCVLLVLSMCLCMILASCKPDDVEPTPPPAQTSGQVHKTPDSSSGVDLNMPNQIVDDQTTQRY